MSASIQSRRAVQSLTQNFKRLRVGPEATTSSRLSSRSYATITETPVAVSDPIPVAVPEFRPTLSGGHALSKSKSPQIAVLDQRVPVTIHSWPTLEPRTFQHYPASFLRAPLRRDLLHRAVVFEGNNTRRGTASTKTRWETAYAKNAKIRPQKGSGRARLRDRGNPMLRGGGVSHGPKPRDFSTELPAQIYATAIHTALSYRYARGELTVTQPIALQDKSMHIENEDVSASQGLRWLNNVLGSFSPKKRAHRTLLVTMPKKDDARFLRAMAILEEAKKEGKAAGPAVGRLKWRSAFAVDVKNILEAGNVIIEQEALDFLGQERRRIKAERSS